MTHFFLGLRDSYASWATKLGVVVTLPLLTSLGAIAQATSDLDPTPIVELPNRPVAVIDHSITERPARASASAQNCGWCYDHVVYDQEFHSFQTLGYRYRCDNTGGCHLWWHVGKCRTYHELCYLEPIGLVELAIAERNSLDLQKLLASSNNWEYDSADRTLSFTCSDYAIASYVLPEELAEVVINLLPPKRVSATAQPGEPQGGSE